MGFSGQFCSMPRCLPTIKRTAPPVQHKQPAKLVHIRQLRDYAEKKQTFVAKCTFILSLAASGGCSRVDDVLKLCLKHCKIRDVYYVRLTLPCTKTDQIRTGNLKWMPKGQDPGLCPVKEFREWLAYGKPDEAVSKTTYSENLKAGLADSGLKRITGHGWRSGFATQALEGGADVSAIQLSGGWAAPISIQPYVKRSQTTKLATAKKAGF